MKLRKGFTLIELMVVISVIAILSTIALLGLRGAQDASKDTKKIATIQGLQIGLEKYYSDNSSYPANWTAITATAFDPVYIRLPTSGDSQITSCSIWTTGPAPCVNYTGAVAGYTLSFLRKAGGTMTYNNPN